MKKKIYLVGALSLIILGLSLATTNAQNVGSLKGVVSPGFAFTMDLLPGYTDFQVLQLQKVLNTDISTAVALDGEGSYGKESKFFGEKTKLAVIKFQEKYRDTILTPNGLTKGTGNVGKATRTKLNLLIGVLDTSDSVGKPESGISTAVNNTPVSTIATNLTTNSASINSTSICSFIELLINIDVINSNLANKARSVFACSVVNSSDLTPSVDIRINGKNGTVSISSPRNVTISWTSNNVTSCQSQSSSRPLSGSQSYYVSSSGTFVISCTGPYGTVTDSVAVSLGQENSNTNNANVVVNPSNSSNTQTVNTPVITATKKALTLKGNLGDYIAVNNSSKLDVGSEITLEAWVKPTSWRAENSNGTGGYNTILAKGQVEGNYDYWFGLDQGKIFYNTGRSSSLETCGRIVPLNTWSHIAVVINKNTKEASIYLNGNKVDSICSVNGFKASSGIRSGSSNLYIGNVYPKYCVENGYNAGFVGQIDDVRIWNKTRTGAEIASSSKAIGANVSTTSLVARWTFDSSLPNDVTGNGNNGSTIGVNSGLVSGAPIINTTSDTPSDYFLGVTDYSVVVVNDNVCVYEEDDDLATTSATSTEQLGPDPKTDIGGVVTRVTKCTATKFAGATLTEVEIQPCGSSLTASRYEPDASGVLQPSGTYTGNIFVTIRNGRNEIPKVGDAILARVVPDKSGTCSALEGGVVPSVYHYEGVVSSEYSHSPAGDSCKVTSGGDISGEATTNYTLPYTAVGAAAGTAILPGVGTVTGGAVGFVVGAVRDIFHW